MITLTIPEPLVLNNSNLTITGGTASGGGTQATIRRNPAAGTPPFRVMKVVAITAIINELTIANGATADVDGDGGGGGIAVSAITTLTINGSNITGNVALQGGGIFNKGTLALNNTTISSNVATGLGGGGIYNASGTVTLNNATINGNSANVANSQSNNNGLGGGIYNEGGALTATNTTISNNQSRVGGGVFIFSGTVKLNNTSILDNRAIVSGGGLALGSGTLETISSTLARNSTISAGFGGGVNLVGGTATFAAGTTIRNNTGGLGGGLAAVSNAPLTITIDNSEIAENTAADGASAFIDNVNASLLVRNSTVVRNQSPAGAIITSQQGATTLVNTTVSANISGNGAILRAKPPGALLIVNSTVSENQSTTGALNVVNSAIVKVRNTIIAGNVGADTVSDVVSLGNNLIGNVGTTLGFSAALGDILGTAANPVDPKLRPLALYGGTTQTQPPYADSPALDAGNNCVLNAGCASDNLSQTLTSDQRGRQRFASPANFRVDIGAVELQTAVVVNRNNAGFGSLRGFVDDAFLYDRILFDEDVFSGFNPLITLTSAITINRVLDIVGFGAGRVSVSGGNATRVFDVTASGNAFLLNLGVTGGNSGTSAGGNIANAGTLRLFNCVVSSGRNTATGGGLSIVPGASATIDGCTFSSNSASVGGGIASGGALSVRNSTFAANSAGFGGAINVSGAVSPQFTHVTVAGNTATTSGGGVRYLRSATTNNFGLRNTIVAENTAPSGRDVEGVFNSLGNNLIGVIDAAASGLVDATNGDIVGSVAAPVAANLKPLGNYGGIVPTRPPLPASRAINSGAAVAGITSDQRGLPRAVDGAPDIGATEFNLTPAGALQSDGTRLLVAGSGAYVQPLAAFGGDFIFSFSATSLPAFLTLTPSATLANQATLSGNISAAQAGIYSFSITAANAQAFTVTNNYKLVVAQPFLNIDNSAPNTVYDAATDGVLLIRYLLGYRGADLIAGARGTGAALRDAAQIEVFLATNLANFDVDGDGQTLALTDGLMILRRLLNPIAAISNASAMAAITQSAKRGARTDVEVVTAIDSLKP